MSRDQIHGAILYMFNYGLPALPPPAPVAAADPHHKVVSGMDIYLGMMRAEAVRAAQAQAEKSGTAKVDVPSGKGYYHVNIALADNKSQVPVTDAQVTMRVSDGMTTETKTLGLVAANNAVSYGNFFKFSSGSAYNITTEIRRPGGPARWWRRSNTRSRRAAGGAGRSSRARRQRELAAREPGAGPVRDFAGPIRPLHHLDPAIGAGRPPVLALVGDRQQRMLLRCRAAGNQRQQARAVQGADAVFPGEQLGFGGESRRGGEGAAMELAGSHHARKLAQFLDADWLAQPVPAMNHCRRSLRVGRIQPDIRAGVGAVRPGPCLEAGLGEQAFAHRFEAPPFDVLEYPRAPRGGRWLLAPVRGQGRVFRRTAIRLRGKVGRFLAEQGRLALAPRKRIGPGPDDDVQHQQRKPREQKVGHGKAEAPADRLRHRPGVQRDREHQQQHTQGQQSDGRGQDPA